MLPTIDLRNTVYGKLLDATAEQIKSLKLPGFADSRIVVRDSLLLTDGEVDFPCIIVSYDSETSNPNDGTNETDVVDYGVIVAIAFASEQQLNSEMSLAFYCREKIRRKLQNHSLPVRLPDNCCLRRTRVPGGTTLRVEEARRRGLNAQHVIVRHDVEEPRD